MALRFSRPRRRLSLGIAAMLAAGFALVCSRAAQRRGLSRSLELQDFGYVSAERIAGYQDEAKQSSIRPFKIFDNLYYVGIEWVSSFLLDTGDGLILIDSLHEPYIELAAEHIRELGFDPADVRYVLGVHGHFDHMGGHAYWQRTFGATVGLTAADWKRAQTDAGQEHFGMEVADVDWIIQDAETLTLGDQTDNVLRDARPHRRRVVDGVYGSRR